MDRQTFFSKTRIAPTPSGFLHLGNVFSFALTASLARKAGAKILLRIDDLDRERVRKEYVQDIFDTLNYLEIPWDEGPADYREFEREFSQIHRMELYREALRELRDQGALFACACSRREIARAVRNPAAQDPDGPGGYPGTCHPKKLPFDQAGVSWRLFTNGQKELRIKTLYGPEISTPLPASMKDFIVRKKDGFPAYQLASVVDDGYFGTDLIIRGEDLRESTWAQLYLSGCLGKSPFHTGTFYHHPLLTGTGGRKLSKSAGDTSVRSFRKAGKKPAGVYSRIARMLGLKTPAYDFQDFTEFILKHFIKPG